MSVARELFAVRGYGDTSIDEILGRSGLSKGALYHHFAGKRELFQAVYEQISLELLERSSAEALKVAEPWGQLRAALDGFLDLCMEPDVQRIALIDAPSVLGWSTWRAIDTSHGLGALQGSIDGLMEAGFLIKQPAAPLAHVLLAGLSEAGLLIAAADDPAQMRKEVGAAIALLLDGLRVPPDPTA